jgi:hypothetical protein
MEWHSRMPGKSKEKSKAIIIAGMHRSGTSALTRVINLLGADLASDLVPAGIGNEQGHWESWAALKLHERMLGQLRYDVLSPVDFPQRWFDGPQAQAWTGQIAALVAEEYAGSPLFVVKDPRIVLFLPLWITALQRLSIEPHFVIPFRPPLAVAASLQRRERRFNRDRALPLQLGIAAWLRHVLAAEKYTRGHKRAFVAFDRLLSDWRGELTRIANQLAIAWPRFEAAGGEIDRFLAPDPVATAAPADDYALVRAEIAQVHDALERAVADPQPTPAACVAAAEMAALADELLGAYALLKEREAADLRARLEVAHRTFEAEIRARDARIADAAAYATSLERSRDQAAAYAKSLEQSRDQVAAYVKALEQSRDEALRHAQELEERAEASARAQ